MKKKILASALATLILASALIGCTSSSSSTPASSIKSSSSTPTVSSSKASSTASSSVASSSTPAVAGSITYPLKDGGEVKYWKDMSGDLRRIKPEDNVSEFAKYYQENTGVKINFINPAANQSAEAFNLLLASGELPDVIEKAWLNDYPAGVDDAIKKGFVYPLNDKMNEWAPDLKKTMDEFPGIDKKLKTDSGTYWGFPMIRESAFLCCWRGPVVRKDWLDAVGLSVPETIDDWDKMLRAFKDKYKTETALSIDGINNLLNDGPFCAFGAMPGFYLEGAKVVYGPVDPGFKQTLDVLRKWYADGLFDRNFAANKGPELTALIGQGKVGATIGNTGGGIGAWTPVIKAQDPNAVLVAAPYPTQNKGETAKFGQMEQDYYQNYISATINPKSKNLENTVKLLNYGYTEAGYMFMNYGVEGKSYDMKDGKPVMKEEIAKAADNKAVWSDWARAPYNGPMVQAEEYLKQLLVLQEQKDAIPVWQKNDRAKSILPPISQSVDEARDFNKIKTSLDTMYDEFIAGYVSGTLPETAFDDFVKSAKGAGLEEAIKLRQAAVDRYNAR